jgi:hypothetical protein
MLNELTDFWRKCDLAGPLFAHPDDDPILHQDPEKYVDSSALVFDEFAKSPQFGNFDHRLRLSLLPMPYLGNLSAAEIVILQLNPGLSHCDYWAEERMPAYRKRLEDNLRQTFVNVEFPFLFLDPQFCWHSGFVWWERRLRDVISLIAEQVFDGHYVEALKYMSNKLACLELVPYHSYNFNASRIVDSLPSVQLIKKCAREVFAAEARNGKRTLIVTRQAKRWHLGEQSKRIAIYRPAHARAASLGPDSDGGQAILRHLGLTLSKYEIHRRKKPEQN